MDGETPDVNCALGFGHWTLVIPWEGAMLKVPENLRFDVNGLIPAIAQDAGTARCSFSRT